MNHLANTSPLLCSLEQVSDGWIKKYVVGYKLPDGTYFEYESVSRKSKEEYSRTLTKAQGSLSQQADAVSIVGRTFDNKLLLIKEFRYSVNDWCIALPAGLKEPEESIFDCIERELSEETGFRICEHNGNKLYRSLNQSGFSSLGLGDESVHMVFAFVEPDHEARCESTEFIEVFTLPIADIPNFLKENKLPLGTRCQLILESFVHEITWAECLKGIVTK